MPKLPTANDVKKARMQATQALEQARTPLYAVLGAGDLATEAVREYVMKARSEATGQAKDVQTRVNELQVRLAELQDRLVQVRTQVRTRVDELPDEVAELRGKLEPTELRHALENYVQSLQDLYERLASRGEVKVEKLRQQPQVKKAMGRVEEAADTTEERVGKFVEDARELTYEVLGRVSRRTRSTGEKAAVRTERMAGEVAATAEKAAHQVAAGTEKAAHQVAVSTEKAAHRVAAGTEKAADEIGDAVKDAGHEAAHTTRSVTRKAANRTAAPAKATTRKTTAPRRTITKA